MYSGIFILIVAYANDKIHTSANYIHLAICGFLAFVSVDYTSA